MRYEEAIEWLAEKAAQGEKAALNKEGQVHTFGMDIEEAPERYMVDTIGEPIILTHFPRPIKAFYMQPDPKDLRVTESADILIPGVGEIVGGSMRIYDHDSLVKAFEDNGLPKDPYYWFTDQRKYGSCEHGGYGLGLERFLAWMTHRYTIRYHLLWTWLTSGIVVCTRDSLGDAHLRLNLLLVALIEKSFIELLLDVSLSYTCYLHLISPNINRQATGKPCTAEESHRIQGAEQ